MKKCTLLLALCLLWKLSATCGGLNGIYTIGGNKPDFPSLRKAAKTLMDSGVSGRVIFNIRDGRYKESLKFSAIPGASRTNTVTFQSESRDSAKVIIDSSGTDSPVVLLSNISYLCFKHITILNSFRCTGKVEYDTILNCVVSRIDFTDLSYGRIAHSYIKDLAQIAGTRNTRYDTIVNSRNEVDSNFFSYHGGLYTENCNHVRIHHNVFNLDENGGLALYGCPSGEVYSNRVTMINIHVYAFNGFEIWNSGKYGLSIYNNFISMEGDVYLDGMKLFEDTNTTIAYNSIFLRGKKYIKRGIEFLFSYGWLKNNAIFIDTGKAIDDTSNMSNYDIKSDYNVFYSPHSSLKGALLKRQKFGNDKHSFITDPGFFRFSDLHTLNRSLLGKGTPVPGIITDIDGERRNNVSPDIGADEFGFLKDNDVGISALYPPKYGVCGTDSNVFGIRVRNFGIKTQSGFDIKLQADGNTSASVKYTFRDSIRYRQDTVIYLLLPGLNTSMYGGSYTYTATTLLSNDANTYNDQARAYGYFYKVPQAGFEVSSPCAGTTSFLQSLSRAGSSSSLSYLWYINSDTKDTLAAASYNFPHKGSYIVSLKVTDANGCSDSTGRIIMIDSISAEFTDSSLGGGNIGLHALDTSAKRYIWDFGAGGDEGFSRDTIIKYPKRGKYIVELTIEGKQGCVVSQKRAIDINLSGISDGYDKPGFAFYPNPATSALYIQSNGNGTAILADATGKSRQILLLRPGQNILNIDLLPPGLYFLRFQGGNIASTVRFIKE